MDDIHLKHHIVVHKISQGTLVGNDATDLGSTKEHILRLFLSEKLLHLLLTTEVQLCMGTGDDIAVALAMEFTHNSASYHASMTCDVYLIVLFHHEDF